MTVFVDSSVWARAYFAHETGHGGAVAVPDDPTPGLVTGTRTRIDVSGAIARACRGGRGEMAGLSALLDEDLRDRGRITVVRAAPTDVERSAPALLREHGLRPMDAWHLSVAAIVLPTLLEPCERGGFARRDAMPPVAAQALGWVTKLPDRTHG